MTAEPMTEQQFRWEQAMDREDTRAMMDEVRRLEDEKDKVFDEREDGRSLEWKLKYDHACMAWARAYNRLQDHLKVLLP
jgi:hypothetical protein